MKTPAPLAETGMRPVAATQRISSVDIIRGVALLGILLMNIVGMGLPSAYDDPSNAGGAEGLNLAVFKINSVLFEGTMRGLFSVLFGAGVILFTSKKEARGVGLPIADAWYRRTIWLIVFGMIHGYILLWPGDILWDYGLMGLLIFTFRDAPVRKLIIAAIVLVAVGSIWTTAEYFNVRELESEITEIEETNANEVELTREQDKKLEEWQGLIADFKPDEEEIESHVEEIRAGYISAVKALAGKNLKAETYFTYRYTLFDILSMMLIGMALLKAGVLSAERSTKFYVLMTVIGYSIGIPINLYELSSLITANFDVVVMHRTWLTYDPGRIATMFGHIGLIMLFCKSGIVPFLQRALAAVGRMALTNYIMHTVIATTVFVLFAQYGQWQRYELYYLVIGIWIFQLVFSPIWLKYYRFGPLEWIWRWLTYRKRPQLKRTEAAR